MGDKSSSTYRIEQSRGRSPEETSLGFHDPLRAGLASDDGKASGDKPSRNRRNRNRNRNRDNKGKAPESSRRGRDDSSGREEYSTEQLIAHFSSIRTTDERSAPDVVSPGATPRLHPRDVQPSSPDLSTQLDALDPFFESGTTHHELDPFYNAAQGSDQFPHLAIPPLDLQDTAGGTSAVGDASWYYQDDNTVNVPLEHVLRQEHDEIIQADVSRADAPSPSSSARGESHETRVREEARRREESMGEQRVDKVRAKYEAIAPKKATDLKEGETLQVYTARMKKKYPMGWDESHS